MTAPSLSRPVMMKMMTSSSFEVGEEFGVEEENMSVEDNEKLMGEIMEEDNEEWIGEIMEEIMGYIM